MGAQIGKSNGPRTSNVPSWPRLMNSVRAFTPNFASTRVLSYEIVAIAIENCDDIAPLLARHDRWMAHWLTRQEARRRAAACGAFVAYTRMFDRHGLKTRTLLPGIASCTQHAPEFIGTDMAGHLRMYDQDRTESVVKRWGSWSKNEPDGDVGLRWFGAIFFDNQHHPEVEYAYFDVLDRLGEPIRKRLLGAYWIG